MEESKRLFYEKQKEDWLDAKVKDEPRFLCQVTKNEIGKVGVCGNQESLMSLIAT